MAQPVKTATGKWRIQIEIKGQRDSGTFETRRDALAWRDRRSTELRAVADGTVGDLRTLRDALRTYARDVSPSKRGWAKEIIRLQAFERQALPLDKPLAQVTPADLSAWRDARLAVNARGSVLRDMTLMSSVLESARRDWGWVRGNAMRDVRRPANPDHRERLITGPETRAMLRALGWSRQPVRTVSAAAGGAFLLAMKTGMRAGELCALRWEDIHASHARLQTSKTGAGRDVPLSRSALRTIERLRGFDDERVLGLGSQTLDALFRRARDKAGLSGFTFHDSRHTAATRLAQRLNLLDLCRMFGWRNPKFAAVYYNARAADIAKRLG